MLLRLFFGKISVSAKKRKKKRKEGRKEEGLKEERLDCEKEKKGDERVAIKNRREASTHWKS